VQPASSDRRTRKKSWGTLDLYHYLKWKGEEKKELEVDSGKSKNLFYEKRAGRGAEREKARGKLKELRNRGKTR